MIWKIEYLKSVLKDLKNIDPQIRRRLRSYLEMRIAEIDNPREIGSALKGSKLGEFWRYRVGDYRIICEIKDSALIILAIKIGHSKSIYDD